MTRQPERRETNRARQARFRERRKGHGWKRVVIWLSPEQIDSLETLGGETWLGTTVRELLTCAVAGTEKTQSLKTLSDNAKVPPATPPEPVADNATVPLATPPEPVADNAKVPPATPSEPVVDAATVPPATPPEPVADNGMAPLFATLEAVSGKDKTALWREADGLNKAGLSWNEIARRWNEQGRKTHNGAEYRGANIAREIKKLKEKGVL